MICTNQSNRGPLEKKEKKEEEENKCGSLATADIDGAVGKSDVLWSKRFYTFILPNILLLIGQGFLF